MSLKYSDWHKKNSVFHKLWQWVEINLKSTQNCLEGNSQHLLNSTPDGCNGTILMCSYWLPSTWGHKHIKIIVIGFWNTSLCKILVIFFLFIVCVITDRGFISSDSIYFGNNQIFNRRKKVRKTLSSLVVFFWYCSDH